MEVLSIGKILPAAELNAKQKGKQITKNDSDKNIAIESKSYEYLVNT